MTSPREMYRGSVGLLTREAKLGFHELIYLGGDLVLVYICCVVCQEVSHGPELLG